MEKLVLIFKDASKKTQALTDQANSKQFPEEYLIEDMHGCLNTIEPNNMMISDGVAKHAVGSEVWCAILELIHISSTLTPGEFAQHLTSSAIVENV
ncbi:hypothetical protein PSTG_11489 [Puccinia striiformis f. sp. tritici PST-78]|uniref:Uncharacterized protein n=1 Tax=Puccinia striiformis f. sp. tritici PST-78 TaxID=1165861 RepID=A0A0L0V8A2_9BASI|nr:hypothetical protein PSTG_11489 [Puccinia striiformis f. sp. tritici PST-78]